MQAVPSLPVSSSFEFSGGCLEWVVFESEEDLDYSGKLCCEVLELWVNCEGSMNLRGPDQNVRVIGPGVVAFYQCRPVLRVCRDKGAGRHQFVRLILKMPFLDKALDREFSVLPKGLESFLKGGGGRGSVWVWQGVLPLFLLASVRLLERPPVSSACAGLWYRAKILEILAGIFSTSPEVDALSSAHKHLARGRVARASELIRAHWEEPLPLAELARRTGCSSCYLSRLFARQTGRTISQYQREVRMEAAARLLAGGRHNVTEAAVQAGYSSLSHFSKAFNEIYGVNPGMYAGQAAAK